MRITTRRFGASRESFLRVDITGALTHGDAVMADLPVSGPSAGGRRFWVTVFIFALLNAGAWVGYHRWVQSQAPRRDILRVQRFAPGEGAVVSTEKPPVLTWAFNLDVGKTGPVRGADGAPLVPGMIQPAVAGEWR